MTLAETATYLAGRDDFILSSHEGPDADGLGAEFALGTALSSFGKKVRIVNAERYSDCYAFIDSTGIIESLMEAKLDDETIRRSTVVLVDTNDVMYTGDVADRIVSKAAETLVIDHHELKGEGSGRICSMPGLSSTCEIIYRIISEMAYDIQEKVASALFAGIVYDSGSFAYSKTGVGTFEVALDLVRRGANPSKIHGALYESSAISVLLLRKDVLSTLELHAGDRIAIQTMTRDVVRNTGSNYQDSEGLINVPLQAAAVEVSVFFKEDDEGTLRCSLRGKGNVNVAQIAQNFGGGGHKSAAGFKSPYPLETIKAKVLLLVESALADR